MSVEAASLHVRVSADTRDAEQGLGRVGSAMQGLAGMAGPAGGLVGGLFDLIGTGARIALAPLQLLGGAFNLLTAPIRIVGGAMLDLAGSVGKTAVAFALGTIGAQTLQQALQGAGDIVVGFNSRLEQSKMAWTTFLGGAADAEAWQWRMQRFAAITPFNFEGLERGYSLLRAYGFALQELEPWMRRLGNASAAVGQGTEGIQRLALTIGQIRQAGRVQGPEARELALMGVPVWEMLGEAVGKTPGQARAMSEAGEISAQTFLTAFSRWIESKGDLMSALNRTLTGAWSTITDSIELGGSLAFRPLFDRISQAAQALAAWLQTDEFSRWSARVNAAVELAMQGFEQLVPVVGQIVGDVAGLLWDLARTAVEALSYLNPFAEHSPSLVSQVDEGTRRILEKYGQLRNIALPFKAGSDEFKRAMEDQRQGVDMLKDAMDAAQNSLERWGKTPIRGEGAAQSRIQSIQDRIADLGGRLAQAELNRAPHRQRENIQRQIDDAQRELRVAQSQYDRTFGRQHRAISQAAADTPAEQPFAVIIRGVKEAKTELEKLTPVYEKQKTILDGMAEASRAYAAAAKVAAGEGIPKRPDDKSILSGDKEAIAKWKEQIEAYKADLGSITTFFDNARTAAQGFRAALDDVRKYGLAGGLSQLLYPPEMPLWPEQQAANQLARKTGEPLPYPKRTIPAFGLTPDDEALNETRRRANEEAIERANQTGREPRLQTMIEPHNLLPPTYQSWGALGERVIADLSRGLTKAWDEHIKPWAAGIWGDLLMELDKSWEANKPKLVELGRQLGAAIVEGIKAELQATLIDPLKGWESPKVQPIPGETARDTAARQEAADAIARQADAEALRRRRGQTGDDKTATDALRDENAAKVARRRTTGQPEPDTIGQQLWDWSVDPAVWPWKRDETQAQGKVVGDAIGAGLEEGLTGKQADVERAARYIIDRGIKTPMMDDLEIHSPSLLAKSWGADVALGLVGGLESKTTSTASAVERWLKTAVLDPLAEGVGKAYQLGRDIAQGLEDGTTGVTPAQRRRDAIDRRRQLALGGWARAGDSYVVGEERAEVFTPGTSGYVHPAVESGGDTYNIVVNAPGATRETTQDIEARVEQVLHRFVSANRRGQPRLELGHTRI